MHLGFVTAQLARASAHSILRPCPWIGATSASRQRGFTFSSSMQACLASPGGGSGAGLGRPLAAGRRADRPARYRCRPQDEKTGRRRGDGDQQAASEQQAAPSPASRDPAPLAPPEAVPQLLVDTQEVLSGLDRFSSELNGFRSELCSLITQMADFQTHLGRRLDALDSQVDGLSKQVKDSMAAILPQIGAFYEVSTPTSSAVAEGRRSLVLKTLADLAEAAELPHATSAKRQMAAALLKVRSCPVAGCTVMGPPGRRRRLAGRQQGKRWAALFLSPHPIPLNTTLPCPALADLPRSRRTRPQLHSGSCWPRGWKRHRRQVSF
jgi:hypothetical protein